jgi:hypothetical protein
MSRPAGWCRAQLTSGPPAERRAVPRSTPDADTTCRYFTSLGGAGSSGTVRDLSTSGLGLELPEAIQVGQLLMARLANQSRCFLTVKIARVVHATPLGGKRWRVGCVAEDPFRDWETASLSSWLG